MQIFNKGDIMLCFTMLDFVRYLACFLVFIFCVKLDPRSEVIFVQYKLMRILVAVKVSLNS